jgi:quercetin dioxygenase-like cupin family protein
MKTAIAMNWDDMEWEEVRPGVKRKVFQGEGCTVVYNSLEPGHEPKPHSHEYEQIAYIPRGEALYTVGETTYKMVPGSIVHVPPSVTHFIKVTGTEPCINIDVFAPRRKDYQQSKLKGVK